MNSGPRCTSRITPLASALEIPHHPLYLRRDSKRRLPRRSVRFVDVLPDTGNIDPTVKDAITDQTRVIAPWTTRGTLLTTTRCKPSPKSRHSPVADAAHSMGAHYHGRPVGTLADLTALSTHPIKPITTGEGGAVVTADADAADAARSFRSRIHP